MLRIFLALWLALTPAFAWAGQMSLLGAGKASGGGGASPTFTNQTFGTNPSCGFSNTCPVNSVVVPTGFIVVGALINNQSASTGTITGISLSGGTCSSTSLTQAQTNSIASGNWGVALFYGTVTGGTCTVTVTFSVPGSLQDAGVALGLLSNLSSTTPGTGCQAQFAPAPGQDQPYLCGSSITVNSGGFGICVFGYNSATALTSSNLTIDSQGTGGTGGNATTIGIGHTIVTETPQFGGVGFVSGGIACAPWS